jgi:hypothetical protein
MSLHNFNPNNKSWKMYTNTITSINTDDILIKPHDGKNLLLEVSGNNNIFFKKGDLSYALEDLIGGSVTSNPYEVSPFLKNFIFFKKGDISYSLEYLVGGGGSSNPNELSPYLKNLITFKREDISYSLEDMLDGGGSSNSYEPSPYLQNVFIFKKGDTSYSLEDLISRGGSSNIILSHIRSDIIPSTNNAFKFGDVSKNWRNAYIRDLSATNIDVRGNILPLNANSSTLGSASKPWSKAYIRDLSATNISISGNILPDNNTSKIGSSSNRWENVFVNDLSVNTINGQTFNAPSNIFFTSVSASGNILFDVSGSNISTISKLFFFKKRSQQ